MPAIGHGWHQNRTASDQLTAQEHAVLKHIMMGKRNREIAEILKVKERSVAGYVVKVLAKLGLSHERELFPLMIVAKAEIREGRELV